MMFVAFGVLACLTVGTLPFVNTFFPVEFLLPFPTFSAVWFTEVLLVIAFEVVIADDVNGLLPKWLLTEILDTVPWPVVVVVECILELEGVMIVVHCVLVTVTDDEKMIPEQDFTGAAVPENMPWSGLSATAAEF